MNETIFWELIENAKTNSPRDFDLRCDLMTKYLVDFSKEDIIEFIIYLEEKLMKLHNSIFWPPTYCMQLHF
jgi:hypothetical protein